MAGYDIGPKIGIDGEAEFRKQINDINTRIKTLGTEMGVVTAQFARNASGQEALGAKTAVLTKQIEAQKEKLSAQQEMLYKVASEFGIADKRTEEWQQTVNKTQAQLYKLENALADTENALDDTGDSLDEAGDSALKFGDVLKANIIGDAIVSGIKKLGSALLGFAKDSVNAGMQFDASMSQVAATMGVSVESIEDLRDTALEMGSTTKFTATEAADALNYMALAGYDAQTSMGMLPTVLNLAAAGGMDLASASDMITDSQTALGLSLKETTTLVDQMAKTASSSNTSVAQLGEAILTVGGTANYMAGGTEQIAAVLGVLADNSIKGEEGGTKLRNIILSLAAPTDKGAAALDKLGVSIFDAEGKMRDFSDIFPELKEAMSGLTEQKQIEAISQIFNSRDIAAVNALMGTSVERWNELGIAISGSAGAAEQMADTQMDNLTGDVTLFKSALEGAQVAVSDQLNPALREFVQSATAGLSEITESGQLAEWVNNLINGFHELLPAITGVTTAMIAYKTASAISGVIDKLKAATESQTIAQAALNAVMNANPFVLVATLIAGVVTALVTLYKTNEDFRDKVNVAWVSVKQTVSSVVSSVVTFFTETVPNAGREMLEFFKSIPSMALEWGRDLIQNFIDGIKEKISALKDAVSNVAQTVEDFLGFSEPKKGPLSNFHTYAPDMMELFASGILANKKTVQNALEDALFFPPNVSGSYADLAGTMRQGRSNLDSSLDRATANMVNGVSTAMAGGRGDLTVKVNVDGAELARATLSDFRRVSKANPEVVSDKL